MTPMTFLHLTDADSDTPVRIRMDLVECLYVHEEKEVAQSFHGRAVATKVHDIFTMVVYGGGQCHGVRETIGDIETQMADVYELAGMTASYAG